MAYRFKKNVDIGNLEAENDDLLMTSFVEKNDLSILMDIKNHRSILLGRTGSGKSALIRYIENKKQNVTRIEPEHLSLKHLSNSTIINYFKELNVNLDLFFKTLWKHIFIVELIKIYYGSDQHKSKNFIESLKESLNNLSKKKQKEKQKRKKAIEYLEKWENEFWQDTEYQVRAIETTLKENFNTELSGSMSFTDLLKTDTKANLNLGSQRNVKEEIINKAQKVINQSHADEIIEIQSILVEQLSKTQKKSFIIIDDLDKNWVDSKIVYDLIKALIEVIKEFRRIPNVKIIIALRTNILYKIFHKNLSRGSQREKYQFLYLKVEWEKNDLQTLINKRLKNLMRGHYTKTSPTIDQILPLPTKNAISGFNYLVDRTFLRPRDLIAYFNLLINNSNGRTTISREIIRKTEREYSQGRLEALNDEWYENYENIYTLYSFLKGGKSTFTIHQIEKDSTQYFFDKIVDNSINEFPNYLHSDLNKFIEDEELDIKPLLKKILLILYNIGIIGIKISSNQAIDYTYQTNVHYATEDIDTDSTKFYVHKMLHKALRININQNS